MATKLDNKGLTVTLTNNTLMGLYLVALGERMIEHNLRVDQAIEGSDIENKLKPYLGDYAKPVSDIAWASMRGGIHPKQIK